MNFKNADQANPTSVINQQINTSKIKPKAPLKIELCLVELEAFQAYGETWLHSTISTLANDKGLMFKRQTESHIHQHRGKVYFTRYSLFDDNETQKAQLLLNNYQSKRGFGNVA